mmetsp:Transcript_102041/g.288138  ORF Transcript_102041/g.288138 Transcript_102041/m.288138 type:complete len:269 (-) Transcript_102041:384-1190(-)
MRRHRRLLWCGGAGDAQVPRGPRLPHREGAALRQAGRRNHRELEQVRRHHRRELLGGGGAGVRDCADGRVGRILAGVLAADPGRSQEHRGHRQLFRLQVLRRRPAGGPRDQRREELRVRAHREPELHHGHRRHGALAVAREVQVEKGDHVHLPGRERSGRRGHGRARGGPCGFRERGQGPREQGICAPASLQRDPADRRIPGEWLHQGGNEGHLGAAEDLRPPRRRQGLLHGGPSADVARAFRVHSHRDRAAYRPQGGYRSPQRGDWR